MKPNSYGPIPESPFEINPESRSPCPGFPMGAEAAGFEVLVTTDKNLSCQQNLAARKIAVVVLGQGRWTLIKPYVAQVVATATPGSYADVEIPFR
jgi:hypothetical protein